MFCFFSSCWKIGMFNWNSDDLAVHTVSCFQRTWDDSEMSFFSVVAIQNILSFIPCPSNAETLLHFLSSSGIYGPDEGWASAYPECRERNQSPINIVDQDTKVSTEYQELTLEGFDTESSNKTSMKNTGKTGTVTRTQASVVGWIFPGLYIIDFNETSIFNTYNDKIETTQFPKKVCIKQIANQWHHHLKLSHVLILYYIN